MTQADIEWISIDKLKPHPQNPRLVTREDVVEGIKAGISEGFHPSNALIVWPQDDCYYILAGHHRLEAAKRAELSELPCWVRSDLDEENAYMLLATDNNQGELSPLEIGKHALNYVPKATGGRGQKGGLSEYAGKLGKNHKTIREYKSAAEVAQNLGVNPQVLLNKAQHLSAIHSLPESCWQEAVNTVLKKDWSAKETQEQVKTAQKGETDKQVIGLFTGKTSLKQLQIIKDLKEKVSNSLEYEDLKEDWIKWFEEYDPIDTKEVQNKRNELESIQAERNFSDEIEDQDERPDLVLADPPWRYDFSESDSRQIENQYPSLSIEDIVEHKPETKNDCVLFLWATVAKLEDSLEVMHGWGFEYKTHAVWDKRKVGMGYWFRGQHEILLVGTKGNISPPDTENRVSSIFSEEREGHSQKPQCVYEWIEAAFPSYKKLEMYSRSPRDGWKAWGNEAKK